MLKISCVAVAALLVLGGCKEEPQAAPKAAVPQKTFAAVPPVEIRTNSPDATVKTWWRLVDIDDREGVDRCIAARTHPMAVIRDSLVTGAMAKSLAERNCDVEVVERDIQKVSIESDTRAIVDVVVRNVTPLKEGVVLDGAAAKVRANGHKYRYLLERTDAAAPWKMSQVYMDWSSIDPANPWRALDY